MDIETLKGIRECPLFEGLTDNEIMDLMHTISAIRIDGKTIEILKL